MVEQDPIMFVYNHPLGNVTIYLGSKSKFLPIEEWKEFKNGASGKVEIRIKVEQLFNNEQQ
jgi:hypothetical protein